MRSSADFILWRKSSDYRFTDLFPSEGWEIGKNMMAFIYGTDVIIVDTEIVDVS